jgi:hypothetical protein
VLPHPPHPREVVFELGELDLELAFGADGVLGEDVEDQLGPVDDARREPVLEPPLLRRAQLVVDEEGFRTRLGERSRGRFWTTSPIGSTPAVRESSRNSPSSSAGSTAEPSTATMNPRSGSAPGAGSGWCCLTIEL